jgi:hypothetical protein
MLTQARVKRKSRLENQKIQNSWEMEGERVGAVGPRRPTILIMERDAPWTAWGKMSQLR